MRHPFAFLPAAALVALSGPALADEAQVTTPVVDFKQCGQRNYPPSALRKDEEGYVVLGVRVDETGAALETKILQSTGTPALDEATDAVFRKCRYAPGKVNGQPAAMWTVVHYAWTLDPSNGKMIDRLEKASLDGDAGSRYLLASFLEPRAKTDAERDKLHELLASAAEAGSSMAQVSLGTMYEKGKRVSRNMGESRRWFRLAAAQGNVYAIDHLRFIDGAP